MLSWILWCMNLFKLWFSQGIWPGVGFQNHMIAWYVIFKGISILFSLVVAQVYTFTNSVGGFPFFHSLSSIYCLRNFLWWPFWLVWGDNIAVLMCISLIIDSQHLFLCFSAICMSLEKYLFISSANFWIRFFVLLI